MKTNTKQLNAVLSQYLDNPNLQIISHSDLPELVASKFERRSKLFAKEGTYKPKNFSSLYHLTTNEPTSFYVAQQEKTYDNDETEELTYIVDVLDNILLGEAEIRYNTESDDHYFKDTPFVGWMETYDGFTRQKHSISRYIAMNAICRAFYDLPLHSSDANSAVLSRWEELVSNDLAELDPADSFGRYTFK